jgi:hypothetical protein
VREIKFKYEPAENLSRFELHLLVAYVQKLTVYTQELEEQLSFLNSRPRLATGLQGETLVARLVKGDQVGGHGDHDVLKGISRLEVKKSNITIMPGKAKIGRWSWNKILGESGGKDYDFLVLVGAADARYRDRYIDPLAPYVVFLLPMEDAERLSRPYGRGGQRIIQATTKSNSSRIGDVTKELFERFQISSSDLEHSIGL